MTDIGHVYICCETYRKNHALYLASESMVDETIGLILRSV